MPPTVTAHVLSFLFIIEMNTLHLQQYVDHISKYENPSPYTIDIYQRALKACALESVEPTPDGISKTWEYLTKRLDSGESTYGFIHNAVAVVKGTLTLHGVAWGKDYNYNLLIAKLRKAKPPTKKAYSDSDINEILRLVQYDPQLFNCIIMMVASSCRVGATRGLAYDMLEKTDVPGVRVWNCRSKGRTYVAAISEYAVEQCLLHNTRNSKLVVPSSDSYERDYVGNMRKRLLTVLQRENKVALRVGKSTLHSVRKWAIGRLQMGDFKNGIAGLAPDEVSRLAGHAVKVGSRITEKNYVDANTYTRDWKNYVAGLYAKSALMTWRLA